jgi:hypothetical protein
VRFRAWGLLVFMYREKQQPPPTASRDPISNEPGGLIPVPELREAPRAVEYVPELEPILLVDCYTYTIRRGRL